MAAQVTPIKSNASRPRFKLDKFRDVAIESRKMKVGVDIELEAGEYRPRDYLTVADPADEALVPEVITVAEGDIVHVPHPLMLSDDRQNEFEAFNKGHDLDRETYNDPDTAEEKTRPLAEQLIGGRPAPMDTYRMAAVIIGEQELWRLLAGGGHSNDVALAWQYVTADQAESLSDPKAQTRRQ